VAGDGLFQRCAHTENGLTTRTNSHRSARQGRRGFHELGQDTYILCQIESVSQSHKQQVARLRRPWERVSTYRRTLRNIGPGGRRAHSGKVPGDGHPPRGDSERGKHCVCAVRCWRQEKQREQPRDNQPINVVLRSSSCSSARRRRCGAEVCAVACHRWGQKVLTSPGWPIGKIDRDGGNGAASRRARPRPSCSRFRQES
jgi:hypothetical protein